jgi:predicted pyridoxine 5'-phosphate oxidase superfamily flavin-nucleotide-binding protein
MKVLNFAAIGRSRRGGSRLGLLRPGSRGEHVLQERYGTGERASRFYDSQFSDRLTPRMVEFIGRMEMAFIATSDAAGDCDCSFRAGQAGFLRVLDERTIAYPEFRGNGVMASLGNILDNPHVGILMVDFTHDLIGLHVNGDAEIVTPAYVQELDQDLSEPGASPGTRPIQWVLVRVTEAFIHCSKHIPKLLPQSRVRHWGTDNPRHKGGDYFGVAARNLAGQPAPSVGAARAADGRVPVPRPEHSGQQDRDRHEMTFML